MTGDARLALRALRLACEAGAVARDASEAHRLVADAKARKFAAFAELADSRDLPVRPERFVAELQRTLPPDAVVVADPGTPCPYLSAYLRDDRTGRHVITNRAHGALGYSLAASVGAQFGRPGSKVVAVMGDGSFGFTVGELETVTRRRLPITFVVISNAVYGWIKAGQRSGFDGRYFSVDFSRTDHARVAETYGVKAWTVQNPDDLRPALAAAMEHDGPTLADIVCQPLHEARAPVSEWVA